MEKLIELLKKNYSVIEQFYWLTSNQFLIYESNLHIKQNGRQSKIRETSDGNSFIEFQRSIYFHLKMLVPPRRNTKSYQYFQYIFSFITNSIVLTVR